MVHNKVHGKVMQGKYYVLFLVYINYKTIIRIIYSITNYRITRVGDNMPNGLQRRITTKSSEPVIAFNNISRNVHGHGHGYS